MRNRFLLLFCIVSPFLLSLCSTGRRLAVPSSIEVHGERYCIDTLRARWLRIGDAPECTYLYFRNMRDSIVDTRKAYYVIGPEKKLTGLLKRDIVDGRVEEYYEDMEWWYYRGDAALFFPPDIGQRLHFLWEDLSPEIRRRMVENDTHFDIQLLVDNNGMILEASQRVFMYPHPLQLDEKLLDFCSRLDVALKNGAVILDASWMKENDIPHAPKRMLLYVTEDGISDGRRELKQVLLEREQEKIRNKN